MHLRLKKRTQATPRFTIRRRVCCNPPSCTEEQTLNKIEKRRVKITFKNPSAPPPAIPDGNNSPASPSSPSRPLPLLLAAASAKGENSSAVANTNEWLPSASLSPKLDRCGTDLEDGRASGVVAAVVAAEGGGGVTARVCDVEGTEEEEKVSEGAVAGDGGGKKEVEGWKKLDAGWWWLDRWSCCWCCDVVAFKRRLILPVPFDRAVDIEFLRRGRRTHQSAVRCAVLQETSECYRRRCDAEQAVVETTNRVDLSAWHLQCKPQNKNDLRYES